MLNTKNKNKIAAVFLLLACFLPLLWRLVQHGPGEAAGLLSDAALGMLVLILALYLPHGLRVPLIALWALCQMLGQELLAAMQRLPAWQDLQYLANPDFVAKTTDGFKLAEPVLGLLFLLLTLPLVFLAPKRPRKRWFAVGLMLALALFGLQHLASRFDHSGSMAARYNPLHWFVRDGLMSTVLVKEVSPFLLKAMELRAQMVVPAGLQELDLSGASLVSGKGKANNVLIIVLEGIPGLYHSEIRQAMGIEQPAPDMPELASATPKAMLIPDFTVHSHQTIRGLYALLCGDFSTLSWRTPKAFELQQNPEYAQQCLPEQLARHGWSTHFLQGAGLGFMNKDQVMPLIGFQEVHGAEWFTQANPFPFIWGPIDEIFFKGAYKYITKLQQQKKPWMLTLLTVGTHQPYGVSDEIAEQYPSRKMASVALLDKAVGPFLEKLRKADLLKNTLVIIVPDESHGSDFGDWTSAWGLAMVLAPEQEHLPRLKRGGYGLVDIEASVLDYLGLPAPPRLIGRSFFRDYSSPREMLSFTASKLRWQRASNQRHECAENGQCWLGRAPSLLGAANMAPEQTGYDQRLADIAKVLDNKVRAHQRGDSVMRFAHGKIRSLPDKMENEWTDNLIGALYLDFPEQSTVEARIRIKVLAAPEEGVRLWLKLKSWENEVLDIVPPTFPILQQDEEANIEFSFANEKARQNFSFHLLGEGQGGKIRIDAFDLRVVRKQDKKQNPAPSR